MKIKLILSIITISLLGISARPGQSQSTDTTLEQMPSELETRWALSALPPALRGDASVYLLDPEQGYQLSQQGTSGVTCIVERTQWELADFRNDIYIPLCYDAAGTETYLKVIIDAAALRAQGMGPDALKAEFEKRWQDGTYKVPEKAGMSYMIAPVQRTIGPPDLEVVTLSLPHFMPYAPYVSNHDIGAQPDLADPASLRNPFIDRQGIDEQSYFVLMVGQAEKAQILANEKALVDDLCAYRDVLCLPDMEQ